MLLSRRLATALMLLVVGVSGARAQGNPLDDVLRQAEDLLNNLKYDSARVSARGVLDPRVRATTNQRTKALMILAAAYYPEEKEHQKPDSAMRALLQIVSTSLDASFPQSITWSGLDSMFAIAKTRGFGIDARVDSQVVVGTGAAAVRVRASKPAKFRMTVTPSQPVGGGAITQAGTAPIVVDSLSPSLQGELHFPAMHNGKPLFESGKYDITIVARDPSNDSTVTIRHEVMIESPPMDTAIVPVTFDTTKLLKERSGRFGFRGVLAGAIVGGAVYGLANFLRADSLATPKTGTAIGVDSKGIPIAGALAGSVLLFSILDPGRDLPGNILANAKMRENFAKQQRDVKAANAQKVATYRTTIRMAGGK